MQETTQKIPTIAKAIVCALPAADARTLCRKDPAMVVHETLESLQPSPQWEKVTCEDCLEERRRVS